MKSFKKWKILNDSDRQSQHSRQINKIDSTGTLHLQQKQKSHSKAYIPLKRKKASNSNSSNQNIFINNSKTLTLSNDKQFYIPSLTSLSHKYIRYENSHSARNVEKLKTEVSNPGDTAIRLDSLEDIQQKGFGFGGLSERTPSVQLRRSFEVNSKFMSQRNTQRLFFRQPSIPQINIPCEKNDNMNSAFKKKQTTVTPKVQKIKENIRNLRSEQKIIKFEIKDKLQQYKKEMKAFEQQLSTKIKEQTQQEKKRKVIAQIFEQYKEYKPKIDELESQKQIFLQALIRMAPV